MSLSNEQSFRERIEKKVDEYSKHPLGQAIFNFLFTGMIVAFITFWLNNQVTTHNQQTISLEKVQLAVKQITDLMYERRTTGAMIALSIRRSAADKELTDRKTRYDDVYVRYNSTIQSNMFSLRSIVNDHDYRIFDNFIQTRLAPMLAVYDRCITAAYDLALDPDTTNRLLAKEALDRCSYDVPIAHSDLPERFLGSLILRCEYSLTSALSLSVEGKHIDDVSEQSAVRRMRKFCNIGNDWLDVVEKSY